MLRRSGLQALRAALELATGDPRQWRSVNAIAAAQGLPAPMLEQLLLLLRRSDLVEARRGRLGGYRLKRPARQIPVAELLGAVGAMPERRHTGAVTLPTGTGGDAEGDTTEAEAQVLQALERRLHRALERELAALSLEDLLYDLRSWRETLGNEGGLLLG